MLKIYGSDLSGPAIKVRLTANYLKIPYQWQFVNLREKEQKQEWFLRINPIGKVPAIDDDGFCLFESNAICKYLADKHNSPLYLKDAKARAIIDQWIDYVSFHVGTNVATITFNRIFAPRTGQVVNESAIESAQKLLDANIPIIEKQITQQGFIATNQITLTDIVLLAMLEPVDKAQISLSAYPNLIAWRANLKKQSFYADCYKEYGEPVNK